MRLFLLEGAVNLPNGSSEILWVPILSQGSYAVRTAWRIPIGHIIDRVFCGSPVILLIADDPKMWFVRFDGISIGGQSLDICRFDAPCVALPDTGTSFIAGTKIVVSNTRQLQYE